MLNSFLGAACAGAPLTKKTVATMAAKKRANGVMVQSSLSVRCIPDRGLARHRCQSWRSRSPGLLSRRALEHVPLKRQLSDLTLRGAKRSRNPSRPTLSALEQCPCQADSLMFSGSVRMECLVDRQRAQESGDSLLAPRYFSTMARLHRPDQQGGRCCDPVVL